MNAAYLHLLLNHLPVIGTIFGLLLLLWAMLRKGKELQSAGLGVFVLAALAAVPVYLSGEPAEKVAEHLPGVAESFIESHERVALMALVAVIVTGVVSLAGLVLHRHAEKFPSYVAPVVLALAVITSGLMGWTANLGGQIRHTEIRSGSATLTSPEVNHQENQKEGQPVRKKDHDD